jgi:hypothetical protein
VRERERRCQLLAVFARAGDVRNANGVASHAPATILVRDIGDGAGERIAYQHGFSAGRIWKGGAVALRKEAHEARELAFCESEGWHPPRRALGRDEIPIRPLGVKRWPDGMTVGSPQELEQPLWTYAQALTEER